MTLSLEATEKLLGWGWPGGTRSPLHEYLVPVVGTLTILFCGLLIGQFAAARRTVSAAGKGDMVTERTP
jgi:hypothetical protein